MMSHMGTLNQVVQTASWKTIALGRDFTSDPTDLNISGVPAGAPIRIINHVYYGDGAWLYDQNVSQSNTGGNFLDFDYMDEITPVLVYGNISWQRTSTTNIRFQYFMDYSNVPPGYWIPSIVRIEAYF